MVNDHATNATEPGLSPRAVELYQNTYQSLTERISSRGYAPTSLTGAYGGMFMRDTAIQIMAQNAYGDYDKSRAMLRFVLGAHVALDSGYVRHIIGDFTDEPYGNTKEISGCRLPAVQEIPAGDAPITAVRVRLHGASAATGTVKATLYRGGTAPQQAVDTDQVAAVPAADGWITFRFGFPLQPAAAGASYFLQLAADDAAEPVDWTAYEALRSRVVVYSEEVQPDGNYMLIHAWVQYVNGCLDNEANRTFIRHSYPVIRRFADHFLTDEHLHPEWDLLYTAFLEHSRLGRKWQAYDLITNVFASQALHELSAVAAAQGDQVAAARWAAASRRLTDGIRKHLITDVDGKPIYGEMYDAGEAMALWKGFSWVNLAPIAAQWYAADPVIVRNTLEAYRQYATKVFFERWPMLDAIYYMEEHRDKAGVDSSHVIAKGLSWEMMHSRDVGDQQRLDYLMRFVLENAPDSGVYPESYWLNGHLSDVGNQEHASWQHYAVSYIYPQLTKNHSRRVLAGLADGHPEAAALLQDEAATKEQLDAMIARLQTAL